MVVDPGSGIDRGFPRAIRIPAGHDDVACRSIALKPDEAVPSVDFHSARVSIGAIESQVDGLRPGSVGISRRDINVGFVEWVCAVVQARPVGSGKHRGPSSPADVPRPEVVSRIREIQPLAVSGDERGTRPAGRGIDRHTGRRVGVAVLAAPKEHQQCNGTQAESQRTDFRTRAQCFVWHDIPWARVIQTTRTRLQDVKSTLLHPAHPSARWRMAGYRPIDAEPDGLRWKRPAPPPTAGYSRPPF